MMRQSKEQSLLLLFIMLLDHSIPPLIKHGLIMLSGALRINILYVIHHYAELMLKSTMKLVR